MIDIVLSGVGGQGLRLASKILSVISILRDWNVCTYDTNPWVKVGQSWNIFVRIPDEDENPLPPYIMDGEAQLVIAFDPYEAARSVRFLRSNGTMITATTPVQPVPSPTGPKRYDVQAVLQETQLAFYNGMAQKVASKQGVTSSQPRFVPVNDASFTSTLGVDTDNVLVSILLAQAVRIGSLPITVNELCGAITSCVKPEFNDVNLQAVSLVMSI